MMMMNSCLRSGLLDDYKDQVPASLTLEADVANSHRAHLKNLCGCFMMPHFPQATSRRNSRKLLPGGGLDQVWPPREGAVAATPSSPHPLKSPLCHRLLHFRFIATI